MSIAIVGAGLAGFAYATALSTAGHAVAVTYTLDVRWNALEGGR